MKTTGQGYNCKYVKCCNQAPKRITSYIKRITYVKPFGKL